jgi:hypothetical protein
MLYQEKSGNSAVDGRQGDLIGRTFTQWAIVYFGQFFDKYKST